MTPERMQHAYELFEQVLQRPPEERAAFLVEACGNDAELHAEVESLLEHDSRAAADFLRSPEPAYGSGSLGTTSRPDPLIGSHVGSFHIKQVIASGGMGTVYEAVQEHPHRTVALKVMKQNVASRSALRRFQFEAQILGRLRHPNIAQVIQAGMHDDGSGGMPYFALEYIPGAKPITNYVTEKGRNTSDRLWLFANVCDAVHHGHQKGIIHRDLKPANILVDSAGEPKVIDFGVARATDSDLSITTQQTDIGQLVGTMQYMSPEQCDADPHDIDTRSDIYSLGVALYELLTGELPYEASSTTLYAATRAIKEQTPRRPSSINRRLRGDVETIVLKALEKDRDRRYQSAADLAQDIRRHLNREPIAARPPSGWTRTVHWVVRNPAITAAVACLGICAIVATAIVIAVAYYPHRAVDTPPGNTRAFRLEFSIDPLGHYGNGGPEAHLYTRGGGLLKWWSRDMGVRFAELVERPSEFGGGQLALLGFKDSLESPFPGTLCAFDADGDLIKPVWKRCVETEDILPELRSFRGATGEEFVFQHAWLFDVFPEEKFPQHPGPEIIAYYTFWYRSQSVIRIYDLSGKLLYQAWHDGTLHSCYWMSDAERLVFSGNCHWHCHDNEGSQLGLKRLDHVVFALRPEPDFIADRYLDYLSCQLGDERLDPVWYVRLMPDNAPDLVRGVTLRRPPSDPGRRVRFDVRLNNVMLGGIMAVIDEFGEEVPVQRIESDGYKTNQNLPDADPAKLDVPDPDEFKLVPMTLADVMPGSTYGCSDTGNDRP